MTIDASTLRRIISNAARAREDDGDESGRLALLALMDALDAEVEGHTTDVGVFTEHDDNGNVGVLTIYEL